MIVGCDRHCHYRLVLRRNHDWIDSGYYSLQYYSRMKKAMARWRYFSLWQNNEAGVRKLAHRRAEIIQEAEELFQLGKG